MEKLCKRRALYLQGAFGAKLLTAEATDAFFAVDDGFFILYDNSLCRTDVAANAASDTNAFHKGGSRFEDGTRNFSEEAFYGIFAVS